MKPAFLRVFGMIEYKCQTCNGGLCQRRCAPRAVTISSPYYLGRPTKANEVDLLVGNELAILTIGDETFPAPNGGWSHDLIERYVIAYTQRVGESGTSWDIHIGTQWVGSSEV